MGPFGGGIEIVCGALLLLATISVAIPSSKIPIMLSTASPGEQRVAEVRASRAR
jgi:hypothetical protein